MIKDEKKLSWKDCDNIEHFPLTAPIVILIKYLAVTLIIWYAIYGFFWREALMHSVGFIESPSKSGRTHYLALRPSPFYEKDVCWLDVYIPVKMEIMIKKGGARCIE